MAPQRHRARSCLRPYCHVRCWARSCLCPCCHVRYWALLRTIKPVPLLPCPFVFTMSAGLSRPCDPSRSREAASVGGARAKRHTQSLLCTLRRAHAAAHVGVSAAATVILVVGAALATGAYAWGGRRRQFV